jgi:hypothetical protein
MFQGCIKIKTLLSQEKKGLVIGIFILIAIVVFGVFFFWNKTLDTPGIESTCIDINSAREYTFDSCYNSKAQVLFLNFRRNALDRYEINSIKVTFTDSSFKEYNLSDLPLKGSFKIYQLTANKNPQNIYLDLDVDSSITKCAQKRRVFVKDCNSTNAQNIVNTPTKNFPQVDLRIHLLELEIKEEIWKEKCSSEWKCSSWEACQDGIQKRVCVDKNNCKVSTDVPDTVKYCSKKCLEDWQCTWASCIEGKTKPSCIDKNNCGTNNSLPQEVSCKFKDECKPNISCSNWSECTIDYNLLNLESSDIKTLQGKKSRICIDQNDCVIPLKEVSDCATGVDVYTRKYSKCGMNYVDVYNKLDNKLVARIDSGTQNNPYLNIKLDEAVSFTYCDYCYNGLLDGDEVRIDCGGSCISCEKKRGPIDLLSNSLFAKLGRWLASFFN